MRIKMTEKIQNIIIATQAYKKWVYADAVAKGNWHAAFNLYAKTFEYYKSLLSLDCELNSSVACFEAVIDYPIEKTLNTETEDLGEFEFGWGA